MVRLAVVMFLKIVLVLVPVAWVQAVSFGFASEAVAVAASVAVVVGRLRCFGLLCFGFRRCCCFGLCFWRRIRVLWRP